MCSSSFSGMSGGRISVPMLADAFCDYRGDHSVEKPANASETGTEKSSQGTSK
jgi:hypothetical protein